jgi:hypothetical protein
MGLKYTPLCSEFDNPKNALSFLMQSPQISPHMEPGARMDHIVVPSTRMMKTKAAVSWFSLSRYQFSRQGLGAGLTDSRGPGNGKNL